MNTEFVGYALRGMLMAPDERRMTSPGAGLRSPSLTATPTICGPVARSTPPGAQLRPEGPRGSSGIARLEDARCVRRQLPLLAASQPWDQRGVSARRKDKSYGSALVSDASAGSKARYFKLKTFDPRYLRSGHGCAGGVFRAKS